MSALTAQNHAPGFADPVHDAQRVFRAVLEAMARPTRAQPVEAWPASPAPLGATAGAILLALCDESTPVWLDPALRAEPAVAAWIRFHTGARTVEHPGDALFAFVSSPSAAPRLADLAQGDDEQPHLSATLVIDTSGVRASGGYTASGPGIPGSADWDGAGLPASVLAQWPANRAQFPRGVDVIVAADRTVTGLPRTTALRTEQGRA